MVKFINFPSEFLKEEKYGLFLEDTKISLDETPILNLHFTVNKYFEPKWVIYKDDELKKDISFNDRKKLKVYRVKNEYDKDFSFGRNSVLNKYTENNEYSNIVKSTLSGIDTEIKIEELDEIFENIKKISKKYNIKVSDNIKAKIDLKSINSSSSIISLFEDESILSSRGEASKKILSIALNLESLEENSLILIDELENSLEPFRIRSITKDIIELSKKNKSGQIILTTHSPYCVQQLEIENIMIVRSIEGVTSCKIPDDNLRYVIYKFPESLFSNKVIVCEGKTELGTINQFNNYLKNKSGIGFEYYGISICCADGDRIIKTSSQFNQLGYEVLVMLDSDIPSLEKEKNEIRKDGVQIVDCTNGNDIETEFLLSFNKEQLFELIDYLIDISESNNIIDIIKNIFSINNNDYKLIYNEVNNHEIYSSKLANSKSFKNKLKNYICGKKMCEIILKTEENKISKINDNLIKIQKWAFNE